MTRSASTEHLRFIDGMRAIAILSVVAYHINVPGVGGGYVGVDLFFVISGFLIVGQILAGVGRGDFTCRGPCLGGSAVPDRGHGKPRQGLGHEGDGGRAIQIVYLDAIDARA